ncbi:MAG: D-glycero-beta-D-manno-heptose 1,7-bisphosphate 7-phosphatase [Proteobacteria bacterium]|nr:D-glycero-beta-D-manno-heptose 1,7-bisphosphate 7-phosphatase [Pseudomonadota bacterium]
MKKNTAVFLDRDGTINEEVEYLSSLEELNIYPNSFEAIRLINESEMLAVVITNQSGVARGYFDDDFVRTVHSRINEILQEKGGYIDRFYYCPHHPTEGKGRYLRSCDCRKPEPGMLIRASEELDIDLARSYMVGDAAKDIELAERVGAKGILVKTGYGKNVTSSDIKPAHIAEDILDAVKWIMKDRQK